MSESLQAVYLAHLGETARSLTGHTCHTDGEDLPEVWELELVTVNVLVIDIGGNHVKIPGGFRLWQERRPRGSFGPTSLSVSTQLNRKKGRSRN